jgi:hypothetical protein
MDAFDRLHVHLASDGPVAFKFWPTPRVVATWVYHLDTTCIAVPRNPPSSADARFVKPNV